MSSTFSDFIFIQNAPNNTWSNIVLISECAETMPNCSLCAAYDTCTACDGGLVVNATADGCTGKRHYQQPAALLQL